MMLHHRAMSSEWSRYFSWLRNIWMNEWMSEWVSRREREEKMSWLSNDLRRSEDFNAKAQTFYKLPAALCMRLGSEVKGEEKLMRELRERSQHRKVLSEREALLEVSWDNQQKSVHWALTTFLGKSRGNSNNNAPPTSWDLTLWKRCCNSIKCMSISAIDLLSMTSLATM